MPLTASTTSRGIIALLTATVYITFFVLIILTVTAMRKDSGSEKDVDDDQLKSALTQLKRIQMSRSQAENQIPSSMRATSQLTAAAKEAPMQRSSMNRVGKSIAKMLAKEPGVVRDVDTVAEEDKQDAESETMETEEEEGEGVETMDEERAIDQGNRGAESEIIEGEDAGTEAKDAKTTIGGELLDADEPETTEDEVDENETVGDDEEANNAESKEDATTNNDVVNAIRKFTPSAVERKETKTKAKTKVNGPNVKRLPDVLIIGARKAGTRAVLRYLRMIPVINGIVPEIQFFSNDENYAKGLEWYRQQMPLAKPGQIVVEKSAEYMHEWSSAERIRKMNSNIKLLLVVRDPYERLVSDYYFLQRWAKMINYTRYYAETDHSLKELCINSTTGEVNEGYGGVNRSNYFFHYNHFLDHFPQKQIHIINGDRLIDDNPAFEMRKVIQFLNINGRGVFQPENFYFNRTKGFYCAKGRGCMDEEKGHKFPDEDPAFVQKLRDYFKPLNEAFYRLSGINFGW